MTSRPHTPQYTMWLDEMGAAKGNHPLNEWRLLGGGSPAWWSVVQVDIHEEESETLEEIDPHWRAKQWLQAAVQDITDEEVLWHKLVTPLTSGAEGMARSLAKHLVTAWQWNIKVRGEDECPPAPSFLNIGQFIMNEEVAGVWESHAGLWPTPVHCSRWVRWPVEENGSQGGKPWRLKPPHWCMLFGMRQTWT